MARIVFATLGSLGDLNPYLAVARALLDRGHQVTIATCDNHRAKVIECGTEYRMLRPDTSEIDRDPELLRRVNDRRSGTEFVLKNFILKRLEETYEDVVSACDGADLLVIHPALFAGPLAAEKLRMKWFSVALAPVSLFSAHDPSVIPSLAWMNPLRRFGHLPHRALHGYFRWHTRSWMQPVHDLRRKLGLPKSDRHPLFEGMHSPYGTLAWFSSVLAPVQLDWPPRTHVTGHCFLPSGQELTPALRDFLNRGDPPVVVSLGSAVAKHFGKVYEESVRSFGELGCRAVLLAGVTPSQQLLEARSENVYVCDAAPHSLLFPRARAVVHHGGINTCGEALRAGIPSLVVPLMHDQPDNAYRLTRIGVARTIPLARYNHRTATTVLRELLENPEYARSCEAIRSRVVAESGVTKTCQITESTLIDNPIRSHNLLVQPANHD